MASALYVDDIYLGGKGGMPVGAVYVQLPDTPDPSELFTGTWENVSTSYAGDFMRAEGGDASAFESGEQDFAFQDHAHSPEDGMSDYLQRFGTGGGSGANSWYGKDRTGKAVEPTSGGYGAPQVATETRPVNKTVRLWKRTA